MDQERTDKALQAVRLEEERLPASRGQLIDKSPLLNTVYSLQTSRPPRGQLGQGEEGSASSCRCGGGGPQSRLNHPSSFQEW